MDFGAGEVSFCNYIVPHFPGTGGVFMCLRRDPPERPQPVPLVAKCVPVRERVGHCEWPAVLEHAAIVQ